MGREGTTRGHALLAPEFGLPGPPFLPKEGEVYWVRTLLYSSTDPAAARPAVVLLVPALASARIQLVTRTSGSPAGVAHPADSSLGLEVAGVSPISSAWSDLPGARTTSGYAGSSASRYGHWCRSISADDAA